jgi:transcriptional regulator with PAS, ATPase and Fis domain
MGTLFLDEIGELPRENQVKLLGVLQDRQFRRVGGATTIPVVARIIAATNCNIEEEIAAGRFRADLYHRLNLIKIELPPLRRTPGDLEPMTRHFLELYSDSGNTPSLGPDVLSLMREYSWPGNLRELEHFIHRSVLLHRSDFLEPEKFPDGHPTESAKQGDSFSLRSLAQVEADHITKVLEAVGWRINGRNGAAELLGLHPSTLRFRMARLNLRRPRHSVK